MYKYEVIVYWSNDDDAFLAEVPELAGCVAHGDSPVAAVTGAQAAIDLWIETARQSGRPVPEPKGCKLRFV